MNSKGKTRSSWSLVLILSTALLASTAPVAEKHDPTKWEEDIRKFEEQDKSNPPREGAVLFVGSSSIRLWKSLDQDFPRIETINRGFGGSQMEDLLHYMDRIVLPYKPSKIVVYEGDNDIAANKKPAQIAKEFHSFVKRVHEKLPRTEIYFIAIKPSPSRWKLAPDARAANALIQTFAERTPRVHFVDIWTPMLGENGEPRPELFVEDNLHLNEKGYALWTEVLKSHLKEQP